MDPHVEVAQDANYQQKCTIYILCTKACRRKCFVILINFALARWYAGYDDTPSLPNFSKIIQGYAYEFPLSLIHLFTQRYVLETTYLQFCC